MTTKITDVSGTALFLRSDNFITFLAKGKAPMATNTPYSLYFKLVSTASIIVESLGTFAKLREANSSFVMSGRLSIGMKRLAPTGRIFMKFDIECFYKIW